jgi:large subunit ribosomal protein L29
MNFSSINEMKKLDNTTLEKEINLVSQELINLRVKKATRQEFKPHEFKKNKKQLAQLLTVKSESEIKQIAK